MSELGDEILACLLLDRQDLIALLFKLAQCSCLLHAYAPRLVSPSFPDTLEVWPCGPALGRAPEGLSRENIVTYIGPLASGCSHATAAALWQNGFGPPRHCTKSLCGSSSLFPQLSG